MLVLCCGMMRAGSTLQYQIAAEIVESLGSGKRMGWVDTQNLGQITNLSAKEGKIIIVKCHNYFAELTDVIAKGDVKAIYAYRDIRDVVVSLMNKLNRSYWQIINEGYIETLMKAYYDWTRLDDILISRYETMTGSVGEEVKAISEYLGISIDNSKVKQLAERFSIDNQLSGIQEFDYQKAGVKVESGALYNPHTLLHSNHIFSGRPDQWKAALSRIQTSLIEDKAYRWLQEVNYPISQPWILRRAVGMGYFIYRHFMYRIFRFVCRRIHKLVDRSPESAS